MTSDVSVIPSFLRVTFSVNVTLSPSFSACMRFEVITSGSRVFLLGRAFPDVAAMRSSDAARNRLVLKHCFDMVLDHDRTDVHIRRYSRPFKVDLASEQLERIGGPDNPFTRLPEERVCREQIAVARNDPDLSGHPTDGSVPICCIHGPFFTKDC